MTLRESAILVGRDIRTIQRWSKKIDITDRDALLAYSQTMDAKSKGRSKTLSLARLGDSEPLESERLDDLPPPGEKGAVQALTRLQELEVRFAQRLNRALNGDDANLIQIARADHCAVAESMRRYEREIEESNRDLGHLVPKSDMIDGIRASAMWMRLAFHSWLSSCLPSILALAHNDREAKHKCIETFCEIIRVTVRNSREANLSIPPEGEAVIFEEFHIS